MAQLVIGEIGLEDANRVHYTERGQHATERAEYDKPSAKTAFGIVGGFYVTAVGYCFMGVVVVVVFLIELCGRSWDECPAAGGRVVRPPRCMSLVCTA